MKAFPNAWAPSATFPPPRHGPATRHCFGEILFIAVGRDEQRQAMEAFSRRREEWLRDHGRGRLLK